MRLPVIHGLIRRRLLVNFRVDSEVMRRFLPAAFRPKLHRGHAIAGICLIRLEQIRPGWLPRFCGISSENAAHRIAVLWIGENRRETSAQGAEVCRLALIESCRDELHCAVIHIVEIGRAHV